MDTILVSSGYHAPTLEMLRRDWRVIDIPNQTDAWIYLTQCDQLPMAIAIGYVRHPDHYATAENLKIRLPAHVMLQRLQKLDPDLPVVISTGEARPAAIVDLMKRGAFDYVIEAHSKTHPNTLEDYNQQLHLALTRAVQWRSTILENRRLKQQAGDQQTGREIKSPSAAMHRVRTQIEKVAPTPATVLVEGESGSGKELVARAIHKQSANASEPFVAINCGSLSESLLTSELFGHVKGAFTGADSDRAGLIRQAGSGTLFLDEIASIPPAFQVMLLRVLEQRVARPVGGQEDYPVQCRFIAASNEPMLQMVRQDRFREDLYYRLNVFHIEVPPLRKRTEDIPILAQHFLQQAALNYQSQLTGFDPMAMQMLERYPWPGNVRQLRNTIERAAILSEGTRIRTADLAGQLDTPDDTFDDFLAGDHATAMKQFEARLLRNALNRANGNLSEAARLLRMKRTTLHYRLKQLQIS